MKSLTGRNNTSDRRATISWNDPASPFRIYEYGILFENKMYKSPIHTLVAIVYGSEFFEKHVLHNYAPTFIMQNFCKCCTVASDADFIRYFDNIFCLEPAQIETVISEAIDTLFKAIYENYASLFVNTTPSLFAPDIVLFCKESKLMKRICMLFVSQCKKTQSMMFVS